MAVRRIILFASGTLLVLAVCAAVIFGAVKDSDPEKETFTLWQLPQESLKVFIGFPILWFV